MPHISVEEDHDHLDDRSLASVGEISVYAIRSMTLGGERRSRGLNPEIIQGSISEKALKGRGLTHTTEFKYGVFDYYLLDSIYLAC